MREDKRASTWLEFWNGETAIYANERHKQLHYELLASDIAALVPCREARILDFGCGEALSAPAVAQSCRELLLYDAAPLVEARLRARFAGAERIVVLNQSALRRIADGSLDLVIAVSLIQYLSREDFCELLRFSRRKLKTGGRLAIGDVPTPQAGRRSDALALLAFGWRGGFFLKALTSLAKLYFSDYRHLRARIGFGRYSAQELEALLGAHGFCPQLMTRNIGPNRRRLSFIANLEDERGMAARRPSLVAGADEV